MRRESISLILVCAILLVAAFAAAFLVYTKATARKAVEVQAPSTWRQLKLGMGIQEVATLLGEPPTKDSLVFPTPAKNALGITVKAPSQHEFWRFSFGITNGPSDGPYVVTFTNGRVSSFGVQ